MKEFLIQTVDGQVVHDFSFHLLEAIRYQNWYRNEKLYSYRFCEDVHDNTYGDNYIPVGSVEFVLDYYKVYHGINNIKPINVPKELMTTEFLKRQVFISDNSTLIDNPPASLFIKPLNRIKGLTFIMSNKDQIGVPDGRFFISEVVGIESEWRGFVFNGELLDIRCYLGEFDLFPDVDLVREMIGAYKNSPRAYTIDVGVGRKLGTFLIECHQFFSTGLYGFTHYNVLPQMFISCHNEILDGNRKEAIEQISNREAVFVTKEHYSVTDELYTDFYCCPMCDSDYLISIFKYCPMCGVLLIWKLKEKEE